ncbi:protein kinase [Nocardia cyriacigeorgica]|uniref:non-specific serine/threonine protein kinase n=1 Tax=Nocardia cyriacigeorgica TaxID=135487 RepID=A0A6P1CZ76_9NOCA|nr:serine/threonine-protein kinase [Nocardia cyriacigeorgica]NEW37735.1 protein kinase [Nocardia cyriacigeorgica]NEW43327.1 protein kinase [Nocardia cyriacigeorgica]NEW56117.1 protein kinase [Nocardia cyriacigeorgica]
MGALEPGSVFAGYTIERLLGVGGMGEVYIARHPRLPRSDAMKVLAAQFTRDDSYRRRFEREADLAASLSHPGIVSVHDRGEADGRLWIALELIDGIDLSALLTTSPGGLPPAEVARAIAEVADALDYAGARGMVHRDVKPANILLARTGHYLLTDFGIARMGPENSDLTGTGMTIGTIAYASPEQMRGLPVEPRSDQYALAATAFHLLTGAQPFTGTSPVAVIMAHAQQPVRSVRQHRPDLPPNVDAVFARAMAKSPQHRFATSRDFAAAFGQALAVSAPHPLAGTANSDRHAPTVVGPGPIGPGRRPVAPRPQGAGIASPRTAPHRYAVLVGGALAVVMVLVVAGVLGVRAFRNDAGAAEAAQLPRRPVTPALPALDKRPDAPVWTLQDIPGPPGSQAETVSALGGDSDIVLVGRTARLPDYDTIGYLDIVDANTGRLRDGAQPIVVDTSERSLRSCVVGASHAAAACHLAGSSIRSDAVIVVDLAAGRIINTVTTPGNIDSLTVAGERFVFVDRPDRPNPPALRSIGMDGRELPAISWSDNRPSVGSMETRHSIDVFGQVRLAMIESAPDPAQPLSKWEFRVIRLEDGTEVLRRETLDKIPDDNWNVFIDGFVFDDGQSPTGIFDRNGTRTADLPSGWRPSVQPTLGEAGLAETSVPTAIKTDGNKTTYAGISPRNGTVLWQNQSYGADDDPERLVLRGLGTLIMTYDMSRMVDAYTGEYVIHPASPSDCTPLGTDGSRVAVAIDLSYTGKRLEVWDGDGDLWEITSEQMPVAIGGKVYLGNLRLF